MTRPAGGVLVPNVELGRPVTAGQRLAAILDLFGAPLAVLSAPRDGLVASLRTCAAVEPGDLVAMLFFEPGEGPAEPSMPC